MVTGNWGGEGKAYLRLKQVKGEFSGKTPSGEPKGVFRVLIDRAAPECCKARFWRAVRGKCQGMAARAIVGHSRGISGAIRGIIGYDNPAYH